MPASARPEKVGVTYDVQVDDDVASGPIVVVHDRWTEKL